MPWYRSKAGRPPRLINQVLTRSHAPEWQELRFDSEPDLRTHREGVEFRAGVGEIRRTHRLVDPAMQIIEHEPDIAIDVPVQTGRDDGLFPACHAVRESQSIVEVDHAVAGCNFPRAPTAARQREGIFRNDAIVGRTTTIVGARLAGNDPAGLCIPAVEL